LRRASSGAAADWRWEIALAHPAPTADARRLAWQVLTAVEQGAFADAALAERLRAADLAPRDRALATQLVYGTLAWQGLLDHAVAQRGRDPRKLDAAIRTLLRLALFQLVRLERVPDFAAVDTAVELSKEVKRGAASGLVNALLRRFLREGKQINPPPRSADLAGHLAVAFSHPRWLVARWLAELDAAETEALLAANNEPAPTVLRVNRQRSDPTRLAAALAEQGVATRPGRFARDALIVEPHGELSALAGYREGWFAPQGEASQLVVDLLDPRPGARILDVCAAPGGKAAAAVERFNDGGIVLALDRQSGGLRLARRAAARLGLDNLIVVRADATALPLNPAWRADAVLVDAPCSGLGTLRQHPEIRWRRTPEDVRALAALQAELLNAAAAHVRRGGVLVYATCTISAAENADLVTEFLAKNPEFTVDDPRAVLPTPARALVDANGFLQTFPHRDGLDGFFAARMKRQ
jgi:16S rRNA (cytosine967-C5)-methyltransferase